MEGLSRMKKKRKQTVRGYAQGFRALVLMVQFLEHGRMTQFRRRILFACSRQACQSTGRRRSIEFRGYGTSRQRRCNFELVERNELAAEALRAIRQRSRPDASTEGRGDRSRQGHGSRDKRSGGQERPDTRPRNKYCSYCNKTITVSQRSVPVIPTSQTRGERCEAAMAAMQEQVSQMAAMVGAMKKRQDEEYATMAFYRH
ncbi:TPA: hypothetical protein N0F65_005996 [Lagenidium giganteum]|uniref:Uncharacterized protein n=1 Tax=Lagenidium giganteum TaxID=4803 RepID=A0AAV2Z9B5_9STRA|nr:TPA: hypothetical protein N0F65_005996 [Lagenidium giganteum]